MPTAPPDCRRRFGMEIPNPGIPLPLLAELPPTADPHSHRGASGRDSGGWQRLSRHLPFLSHPVHGLRQEQLHTAGAQLALQSGSFKAEMGRGPRVGTTLLPPGWAQPLSPACSDPASPKAAAVGRAGMHWDTATAPWALCLRVPHSSPCTAGASPGRARAELCHPSHLPLPQSPACRGQWEMLQGSALIQTIHLFIFLNCIIAADISAHVWFYYISVVILQALNFGPQLSWQRAPKTSVLSYSPRRAVAGHIPAQGGCLQHKSSYSWPKEKGKY